MGPVSAPDTARGGGSRDRDAPWLPDGGHRQQNHWWYFFYYKFLNFPTRQFFLIKTYSLWQIPSKYFTIFPEKRLQVIFRRIISATLIMRRAPLHIVFHCLICPTSICLWTGSNAIYILFLNTALNEIKDIEIWNILKHFLKINLENILQRSPATTS